MLNINCPNIQFNLFKFIFKFKILRVCLKFSKFEISKSYMQSKKYEDFEKEASQFKNILLEYKRSGKRFVDKNFHPTLKIKEREIYIDDSEGSWKRVDDICDAPLFQEDLIDPSFVQQGELGDCYFLAALSRIAKQGYLVPSLFDRNTPNRVLGREIDSINIKCGAVVVYFYCFGRKTPVLIDTLLPMKYGQFRFSSPSDNKKSPWFCLVEKAYAKLNGSYSDITGGTLPHAIYSMFGYYPSNKEISKLQSPEKVSKMSVFDRIMKYQRQGSVMGTAITPSRLQNGVTVSEVKNKGLIPDHCYLLLKARKHNNKQFFCLRNPWGKHEWNGDWSDNSPLWTKELKEGLGMEQAEDGTFWMIDKDFFRYFTTIEVSKPLPPEWFARRFFCQLVPGPHDGYNVESKNADIPSRPNFAFQVIDPIPKGEKCRFHILVEKRQKLYDEKKGTIWNPPSYCVYLAHANGQKLESSRLPYCSRFQMQSNNDLFSFAYEVSGNDDIVTIVLHRLQSCNLIEDCYVLVYCDHDFKLYDIDHPEELFPEEDNAGIIFDNFSTKHLDVARPLRMKKVKDKEVLAFGDLTKTFLIERKKKKEKKKSKDNDSTESESESSEKVKSDKSKDEDKKKESESESDNDDRNDKSKDEDKKKESESESESDNDDRNDKSKDEDKKKESEFESESDNDDRNELINKMKKENEEALKAKDREIREANRKRRAEEEARLKAEEEAKNANDELESLRALLKSMQRQMREKENSIIEMEKKLNDDEKKVKDDKKSELLKKEDELNKKQNEIDEMRIQIENEKNELENEKRMISLEKKRILSEKKRTKQLYEDAAKQNLKPEKKVDDKPRVTIDVNPKKPQQNQRRSQSPAPKPKLLPVCNPAGQKRPLSPAKKPLNEMKPKPSPKPQSSLSTKPKDMIADAPYKKPMQKPKSSLANNKPKNPAECRHITAPTKPKDDVKNKPKISVAVKKPQKEIEAIKLKPKPADAPKPKPSESPKTKPAESPKPKAAESPKPKAAESLKPKAADAPKPKAADAPKPKPAESHKLKVTVSPSKKPDDSPKDVDKDKPIDADNDSKGKAETDAPEEGQKRRKKANIKKFMPKITYE